MLAKCFHVLRLRCCLKEFQLATESHRFYCQERSRVYEWLALGLPNWLRSWQPHGGTAH